MNSNAAPCSLLVPEEVTMLTERRRRLPKAAP